MSDTKSHKKPRVSLIVFILIFILFTGGLLVYLIGLGPVSKNSVSVTVEIPEGNGALQIVEILDEKGLIKNKSLSKVYCKMTGLDSLQANTYIFNKNMSVIEMFNIINTGDTKYIPSKRMTILEGAEVPDIAAEIAAQTGKTKSEVMNVLNDRKFVKDKIEKYWFIDDVVLGDNIRYPLEGYFFPDTYFVAESNDDVESLAEELLDQMGDTLEEMRDDIEQSDLSVHEILTLASIVEGESRYKEDDSKIAGVFMNRLKKDMPFQSDITVLYATGGKKHVDVTSAEMSIDSPYNTYKYPGLPAGPVSCISRSTLKSTLNYSKHDYFYFFAKKDGTVIYSKTFGKHQKVVKKFKWY